MFLRIISGLIFERVHAAQAQIFFGCISRLKFYQVNKTKNSQGFTFDLDFTNIISYITIINKSTLLVQIDLYHLSISIMNYDLGNVQLNNNSDTFSLPYNFNYTDFHPIFLVLGLDDWLN